MSSSAAVATKASKSERVPNPGSTAIWPPAAFPIAQGEPGSLGPAMRLLFGPLRCVRPMRWCRLHGKDQRISVGIIDCI